MASKNEDTMASSNVPSADQGSFEFVPYVAPCIEEDLPLEVMSLACGTFAPKANLGAPCQTLGS